MTNSMNFHLVKSHFELVFICSIYGRLQYHFRMEEGLYNSDVNNFEVTSTWLL